MRPKRLYTTKEGRYYYLIKGKKKYVKVPDGISQKQAIKINIKNIVGTEGKRVRKRRKRIRPKYEKPIYPVTQPAVNQGLPVNFFREGITRETFDEATKVKPKKEIEKTESKKEDEEFEKAKRVLMRKEKKKEKEIEREKFENSTEMPVESSEDKIKKKFLRAIDSEIIRIKDRYEKGDISKDKLNTRVKDEIGRFEKYYNERFGMELDPKEKEFFISEFENRIQGKGYTKGTGLYNTQLENALKQTIKDFVPVVAFDEIGELLSYIKPNMKRFGAIINTATSDSDGSGKNGNSLGHWVSAYINNEDDYPSIEYFDPLGNLPKKNLETVFKEMAEKINPEVMFKFKYNKLKRQADNTATCGLHSLKFLEDRYNCMPFSEASGWDEYIGKMKNKVDDSGDGERDILKSVKKFNKYL